MAKVQLADANHIFKLLFPLEMGREKHAKAKAGLQKLGMWCEEHDMPTPFCPHTPPYEPDEDDA